MMKKIMSMGDQYRLAAEEARKRAERATNELRKEEWLKIAAGWSRLAEASDKAGRGT
jgi:hypothetical protein